MLEIKGEYGKDCKIFIDEVETSAMSTIYSILNHPVSDGKKVRIMPDVHDGVDIVIGFTMPLGDMVNPNHIGVDIGCGVLTAELHELKYSLKEINERIHNVIPMGFAHRQEAKIIGSLPNGLEQICKKLELDYGGVVKQIGTLGGGNHYIEIGESNGKYFLSIHSGSRNFGLQVCKYHAKQAQNHQRGYSYLTGNNMTEYISDMKIAQEFALLNRHTILHDILDAIGHNTKVLSFDTIHNYIDMQRMIIRKGAISAELGKKVAIPMNMRDGVLIGIGKGNADWNYSAPHGAGRIMSRSEAKKNVNIDEFKNTMNNIYSTSINEKTLDESPFAYKDMNIILDCIKDTVDVIDIIKPILNIKA
jgi:RNA-splicing ligase RtcB